MNNNNNFKLFKLISSNGTELLSASCYYCDDCKRCKGCEYAYHCTSCKNSKYLYRCNGLDGKEYYIDNKPMTQEQIDYINQYGWYAFVYYIKQKELENGS